MSIEKMRQMKTNRQNRREQQNWISASPTKGAANQHLCYKNNTSWCLKTLFNKLANILQSTRSMIWV
jgi:hypothetical protein